MSVCWKSINLYNPFVDSGNISDVLKIGLNKELKALVNAQLHGKIYYNNGGWIICLNFTVVLGLKELGIICYTMASIHDKIVELLMWAYKKENIVLWIKALRYA